MLHTNLNPRSDFYSLNKPGYYFLYYDDGSGKHIKSIAHIQYVNHIEESPFDSIDTVFFIDEVKLEGELPILAAPGRAREFRFSYLSLSGLLEMEETTQVEWLAAKLER